MLWLNYHPKTNHIWSNNPRYKNEILLLSNRFKNKGMFVLSYLSSFCIVYHHYYHYYCTWEKSCNIELQMVATKFLGDSMCVCGWESKEKQPWGEEDEEVYLNDKFLFKHNVVICLRMAISRQQEWYNIILLTISYFIAINFYIPVRW